MAICRWWALNAEIELTSERLVPEEYVAGWSGSTCAQHVNSASRRLGMYVALAFAGNAS